MIEDYGQYTYTVREWFSHFVQGALIGTIVGFLFYSSFTGMALFSIYGFFYAHKKKEQLVKERLWLLNLEFRDGLSSISAALNAGYSVENSFTEAVKDLKLMYTTKSLIVGEFEAIVRQIHMNIPVEDILKVFAERSGIDDIKNFAEVFITAKRTGGDLIKIIKATGNTIGDKIEVKREILTMITAKKFESRIMNVIPFCIIIYLKLFSPGFLDPLYHNLFGVIFMSLMLIIYYAVSKVSKKIISIEV